MAPYPSFPGIKIIHTVRQANHRPVGNESGIFVAVAEEETRENYTISVPDI